MCFQEVSFSPPGRPLGAQGDRKGAKLEPEVIEKVVQRHLVEHAKTMAGTVREAWGGPGEVPGSTFCRNAAQRILRRAPEMGSERFFVILGALWESLGAQFPEKNNVWFEVSFSVDF